jgi:phage terminase large subunit-like protein
MSTTPHENASLIELLGSLSAAERLEYFQGLSEAEAASLEYDWKANGRKNQLQPDGKWVLWLILAGRGFGKTRTGAETIRGWVEKYARIHLVGATASDVRNVMMQGESGIMNCFPKHQRPNYEPSKHLVTFHTGAVAETFSADEPERLRGPQCEAFWADELAAWNYLEAAWDNLMFGFRLGSDPRGVITTTPKPLKLLKAILADKNTVVTRGSSYENRSNLAPAFFESIVTKYEGTRLGRQELLAEVLDDVPGALWTLALIDRYRVTSFPTPFVRIVIPIDPAVSTGENSSETGIGVVGLTGNGHVYVLEDLSGRYAPREWATVAINAMRKWHADLIVGEVNNGGDLVEANLRAVNPNIPFRQVRASRGKLRRAEPVANLYEQGRVHHWINPDSPRHLEAMETQMCGYVAGADQDSPDRMDALVWGITELLIDVDQTESYQSIVTPVSISRF